MNAIEKRIDGLYHFMADSTARPDLEAYWEQTLRLNADGVPYRRTEEQTPMQASVSRLTYEAHDGTPIHGWYLLPPQPIRTPCPCIVIYHGYQGSKNEPESYASWLLMGFAVYAIDVRGQGGETGNLAPQNYGMTKGWVTQGILDKHECYYKHITLDALRAVQAASEQPEIDAERIFVMGTSQGGGLALITAALSGRVRGAVANVPNMCHMDFGILNSTSSLAEAAQFVTVFPDKLEQVLQTLSYFDIINLADRITVPVLCSVGLKDMICMPETIFAAYNRLPVKDKTMEVYPFMGHALGRDMDRKAYAFMKRLL
ncbi:alpha/beta fold hydrolase [Paenibacillus filicis]|uniref:Alpha/beta fold hydrolase n=1 Tax=Paenibacillus filicis TaxID=669464 RepID=A0ABU9DSB4_9BACL